MMIDNLLGNAVAHSNQAGFVHIESTLRDSEMMICITNSGSQIDATQIEHVFEPFWRGDTARSATGTHAGLGLSLCKKLADSLGFHIAATLTQGGELLRLSAQFFATPLTILNSSRPSLPVVLPLGGLLGRIAA